MNEVNQSYSFNYTQYSNDEFDPKMQSASRDVTLSQDDPWPKVMYQFCLFLSGVYGYDIADQITIYNKYNDSYQTLTSRVFDSGGYPDTSAFEDEDE